MNIYCNHSWVVGVCGTYSDCWRMCTRCNTKWWPIKESKDVPVHWLIRLLFGTSTHGIYGTEPKVAVGRIAE
jgi:hypothetical protein